MSKRGEFLKDLAEYMKDNPSLRYGQAVFNLAYMKGLLPPPCVWHEVKWEPDPFYDDSKVDEFLGLLFEKED